MNGTAAAGPGGLPAYLIRASPLNHWGVCRLAGSYWPETYRSLGKHMLPKMEGGSYHVLVPGDHMLKYNYIYERKYSHFTTRL